MYQVLVLFTFHDLNVLMSYTDYSEIKISNFFIAPLLII